ncbi:helix-turn-helix domain-containing protein [Acinetobacter sp. FL51]|uniref:LexA family protein n=1 Tax=Acinetobacter sp. FL51 TaxID=2777978 RepID=UPI0018E0FEE9|nr:XRE family transcriptional regulator [Acinetobacter sp. FL51]MBI1450350.1 helix-turn-helix domain-containing protein [Acinetobacter sp. FL51]
MGFELGTAIKKLRVEKKMSQALLAEKVGVSTPNISRYESGKQNPEFDKMKDIAEALNVKMSDLILMAEGNNVKTGPDLYRVPLISWVQAGNLKEVFINSDMDNLEWVETTYRARKCTYALRVVGDSMEPKFPEGSIIIVEPEEQANNKSFVIVRQDGDKATFKQLIDDGSERYLKPINERYPIIPFSSDSEICGVVKRMEMDV